MKTYAVGFIWPHSIIKEFFFVKTKKCVDIFVLFNIVWHGTCKLKPCYLRKSWVSLLFNKMEKQMVAIHYTLPKLNFEIWGIMAS